jgi:4-amino-4-deoxy-L-arabinose transferase-like glycosyltransferase
VAIVLLTLVLRVSLVLATPHFAPREDSVVYDTGAVSLAHTGHFFPGSLPTLHRGATAFYPPLFQFLLAGIYKVVGTSSGHSRWEAGRLFEALLGAAVVLLVYLIAARLWRPRVALVAAGLAAISPPLVMVGSSSLLSESLFIPLVLAAVLAALHFREDPRIRWAVVSGVMIGAAALTRANGAFLVIPIGFLMWVKRPRFSLRALAPPLAALAATIVVLVPWTVRNAQAFHRFVPLDTGTGYTLDGTFNTAVQTREHRFPAMWVMPQAHVQQLYAANPHANEASVSAHLTSEALSYIGDHPGSVLKTLYWNTVRMLDLTPSVERFFAPYEVYPTWLAMLSVYAFWALIPLFIAGAFFTDARAAPRSFWGVPLTLYLSGVLVLGLTRGRSPLDPFLLMLAAIALDGIYEAIRARAAIRSRKSGAHRRSATPERSVSPTNARPAVAE